MFAPEHFQCHVHVHVHVLKPHQGIEGVVVLVDDTDHRQDKGKTQLPPYSSSHSIRETWSHTGSREMIIDQPSIKFLGEVVDHNGIRPNPDKVKAIQEMPPP